MSHATADYELDAKPNILYLNSHDTGRMIQPYGFQVPTPNLQRLADQGVLFHEAFCTAPTCSGSRASLLTGLHCHNNGMMGLAHRGWSLKDYGQHLIHTLRDVGYRSVLVGVEHISADPSVIGYDRVLEVDSDRAGEVAPRAVEALKEGIPEPWFMSVGFLETHRRFFAPTSIRDVLYSLPAPNLPKTADTRSDMAGFKTSARALDQGIGTVLRTLHELNLADQTLVVCTTDHGIPFPGAKATLSDRGIGVMLIIRGPGGFTGGRVIDAQVSHLDVYPTLCDLAAVDRPVWLQGSSLLPLIRGETDRLHEALFAEMTYHAAYEPQRAIRTERWKYIKRFDDYPHPTLANCDDGPSKDVLIRAGWEDRLVAEEQLYDLEFDPCESDNLAVEASHRKVLADLRERLAHWMRETHDPLIEGAVEPPPGAVLNDRWQVSPEEPTRVVGP